MQKPPDEVLDAPATALRVRALAQAGALPKAKLDEALDVVAGARDVSGTLRSLALICGVALLALAAVCFVVVSWGAVASIARMAIVGGLLAGSSVTAARLGVTTPAGQVALFLSSALIGPLLWLYTRAYPTDASAWQPFTWWIALAAVFAIAGRAPAIVLLCLVLAHVAVPSFVADELLVAAAYSTQASTTALVLLAVDGGVLLVAAGTVARLRWRPSLVVTRAAALLGALVALSAGGAAIVFDDLGGWRPVLVVGAVTFAAITGLPWRTRDGFCVALAAYLAAGLVIVAAGRALLAEDVNATTLFSQAVVVVIVVGSVTAWLSTTLRRRGVHEEEP